MNYRNILAGIAALAFVLCAHLANAETIAGRVVSVHDGDTVGVETADRHG